MGKSGTILFFATIVLAVIIIVAAYSIIQQKSAGQKVLLETNYGDIVIELYSDMPITAGNFINLTNEGFYDGVLFHRVIDGFVIQGGDPLTKDTANKNSWGSGGPGYTIKDEFPSGYKHSNKKYTIAMANAGPNTGGSQFFINLEDNVLLDGKHPVFGEVVKGKDVVDTIAKVPTGARDIPLEEVKIIKASVLE